MNKVESLPPLVSLASSAPQVQVIGSARRTPAGRPGRRCRKRAAAAKGGQARRRPVGQTIAVEAAKVVTAPMPQTITTVGSLRSDESVTLRPESAGRISAITFQEGQRVAKGAPLVKLDPAIPGAELQQAKANLTLAKAKFDRAVDLANRNYISGQAKDEAENNYKVAQATLQLAEAKLAKTEIRAPFAGIIGLRSVSVGDYVKEGADLVNLESIDPLKVDFRVPETYLRQVQVGQLLTITLDAMPGSTFDGKVVAVNPLVDAAGPLDRHPRAGAQPGHVAAPRHVRARAPHHQGAGGRDDAARAGARAAGHRAIRVQGRRRQGRRA